MSDNRNIADLDVLAELAVEVGLDKQRFLQDYASQDRIQEVKRDRKLARKFDIQSTPSLVINEQWVISEVQPLNELRKQLKQIQQRVNLEQSVIQVVNTTAKAC